MVDWAALYAGTVCGRFSITGDLDFYAEYFGVDEVRADALSPSWNVAPTDEIYVVSESDGQRNLGSMRWGLVPHWAKDPRKIHINARLETVAKSPTFRHSFSNKRCLIPADGFYEWEPPEQGRHPHWIYRADGHPTVFAGIWAARFDDEAQAWHRSCAIVTTTAAGPVAPIHDRMPLILHRETWDQWLDRDLTDPNTVLGLTSGIDPDEMMEHQVSRKVNSVKNDGPDLRQPSDAETLF